MNPKVIVFDVDDTLYPEIEFVRSGFRTVSNSLATKPGEADTFFSFLIETFKREGSGTLFNQLLDRYPSKLSVQELVERYRFHKPEISPYPGLKDFLERAHVNSIHLAILTDGQRDIQSQKLEVLGVDHFFEKACFTPELGDSHLKPSDKGFKWIEKEFGVQSSKFMYVADNCTKDFKAPNALGWASVRYLNPLQLYKDLPPKPSEGPAHTFSDYNSFGEALFPK